MSNCGYSTVGPVWDTTINGKSATILEYTDNGTVIPIAQTIFREEDNQIYFYENNKFKLLYDFNLITGDTLTFSIPYNWSYYDFTCGNSPDTSKFAQVKIDSTEMLSIDGQSLKSMYTSPIYLNDANFYFSWQLGQIVERIGSYSGIFGFSTTQCLGGFPGNIRCYNDNLINFKNVAIDCDFVTGTNKNSKNNIISIYPNPSYGLFNISINSFQFDEAEVEVSDVTGKLLKRTILENNNRAIDLTNYPKGLYFVKVKIGENIIIKKVVYQ